MIETKLTPECRGQKARSMQKLYHHPPILDFYSSCIDTDEGKYVKLLLMLSLTELAQKHMETRKSLESTHLCQDIIHVCSSQIGEIIILSVCVDFQCVPTLPSPSSSPA